MRALPDRVVCEVRGRRVLDADTMRRAAQRGAPTIEFVFVRDDGWGLGAGGQFAAEAFRHASDWRFVLHVAEHQRIVEVLTPDAFEARLSHFFEHARVADLVARDAERVFAPQCRRCEWSPPAVPRAEVPEALVDAVTCQCRFCRKADAWHEDEAKAATRSLSAQLRGDYAEAATFDQARTNALDAAAKCLGLCEGKVAR